MVLGKKGSGLAKIIAFEVIGRMAVDLDESWRWLVGSGQKLDHRSFAGPVGPNDDYQLTRKN